MINAKFAICNEVFDNYLLLLNLEKSQKIFYEQSYIVWLYASDEVIKNLNDFAKAFANPAKNKNSEEKKKVGKCLQKLIYSMRKDIKGKTTLKSEEFITTTVLKGSGNG